ncbi:hypothetical protein H8Z59_12945 [Mycolicibacterium fortuitum]|uniref:hypothetical protein n=1 Tax=Mycolicibacterium fortuitum TaxID=1766 RepID=UPI001CDD7025|nr:hypothetical protein [Mycolicibacterium fortuitum]UBV25060.1 hypothetical protein H8Z59_12945 [Mycolicibacterium fortuitum]
MREPPGRLGSLLVLLRAPLGHQRQQLLCAGIDVVNHLDGCWLTCGIGAGDLRWLVRVVGCLGRDVDVVMFGLVRGFVLVLILLSWAKFRVVGCWCCHTMASVAGLFAM